MNNQEPIEFSAARPDQLAFSQRIRIKQPNNWCTSVGTVSFGIDSITQAAAYIAKFEAA